MRACTANSDQRSLKRNVPVGDFSRVDKTPIGERQGAAKHQGGARSAGHIDPPGGVAPHSGRISPGRYPERAFQSTALIFEFLQIFFENVTRPSFNDSYTASL
jgi:hypothetical protein